MFLKIADNGDEKDPIGRVKSVTQEQERTLAGMKYHEQARGDRALCSGGEVILNQKQEPLAGLLGRDADRW